MRHLSAILLLFVAIGLKAQPWFQRVDSVVVKHGNDTLKSAWSGGINYPQVSDIDLNQDGINDLFVFDRAGDRLLTFINKGTPGQVDYHYAPQYRKAFPILWYWALLADYNCDGKEDIFSFSEQAAGIQVYRNDSEPGKLKFTLVTPLLHFDDVQSKEIMYVSAADLPAIDDIDGDGDLDILTFNVIGTSIVYFENRSKDLYGHCDSLKYVVNSGCWGNFTENFSNNRLNLNQSCKANVYDKPQAGTTLHAGSCQLCIDMDGDKDKDIILGDIAYPTLNYLTNGGDNKTAHIIAQDSTFPSYDVPLHMNLFPCGFSLDLNNDSLNDLLVCPNAPNISRNWNNTAYYKNTGSATAPVFSYQNDNLLSSEMIDNGEGAYPVFFDHDADGLIDLLIGNYGYYSDTTSEYPSMIALYKNIGTANTPAFQLVTRDYAGIYNLLIQNPVPTFGDLDNDNDPDMLIGDVNGNFHYFENIAGAGNPCNFAVKKFMLNDSSGNTIDVGQHATPQLFDVNKDGLLDIVCGERSGNLNYYQNVGTANNALFALKSSKFGNVDVAPDGNLTGYSFPFMFSQNSTLKLLVGSENGNIFMYDNIDNNWSGNFNLLDSNYQWMNEGSITALHGSDINNDGLMDLVIGNYAGGVALYMGQASVSVNKTKHRSPGVLIFPNPANATVNVFIEAGLKNAEVSLADVLGRERRRYFVQSGNIQMDIAGLPSGIYFVKVLCDGTSTVKQLLIE